MKTPWVFLASIFGFLAVALGAFGAHALEGKISARGLEIWQTAVQYQMFHTVALLGLGLWATAHPWMPTGAPGWLFTGGILVFSGSLYALALTDVKWLGAVTPVGGVAFLLGWISFGVLAWKA